MAGLIVADASALIAYLNPRDAHHADAVQGLIDVDQFVVHPVTLAEVLVHPARSGSESTWWAPRFPDGRRTRNPRRGSFSWWLSTGGCCVHKPG